MSWRLDSLASRPTVRRRSSSNCSTFQRRPDGWRRPFGCAGWACRCRKGPSAVGQKQMTVSAVDLRDLIQHFNFKKFFKYFFRKHLEKFEFLNF